MRAAGARNEKQPDIKLPPPVAATRCRHYDVRCKQTKEKVGLTPGYERFRDLLAHNDGQRLASLFDWKAPLEGAGLPAWDSLFKSHSDARADVPRLAQPSALNQAAKLRRGDKANRSLPRAAAHAFRSSVQGGGYFIPPVRPDAINGANNGFNKDLLALLFHESLHGYGGSLGGTTLGDRDIQEKLFGRDKKGNWRKEVGAASNNITERIKKNCF